MKSTVVFIPGILDTGILDIKGLSILMLSYPFGNSGIISIFKYIYI